MLNATFECKKPVNVQQNVKIFCPFLWNISDIVRCFEFSPVFVSSQVKKAVGGQSRGMALYEDDVRSTHAF